MSDVQVIQDPRALEHDFYARVFYFSYSGINRLLYSPKLFYKHYIQNVREQLDSHLVDGKIIHALLLDGDNFNKQFIISPANLPGDNTRKIINGVFNNTVIEGDHKELRHYGSEILQALQVMNLHQSLKTDAQRIDKIVNEESESYWGYLIKKGSRTVVDQETLTRCNESVTLIRRNGKICDLLGLCNAEGKEVHNEEMIVSEPKEYKFGFRGIVDNFVIDRVNKILYINDLKTTGKTIADFSDTVDYYQYDIQMSMYIKLLTESIPDFSPEWKIKATFIVIDKYQQVYPFGVSDETISKWSVKFKEILSVINYHYTSKEYELPHLFATTQVEL